jgi:class 3 adenylate cyclase
MSAPLRIHDQILRSGIEDRCGYVFTTAGDAFCAAFHRASDAVTAAGQIQKALGEAAWPGPALRVRIGVHLGEAEERGGDYFGPTVNTAARVEAAGHGGQVLITDPVRTAANSIGTIDLGEHSLKDVPDRVRIFKLAMVSSRRCALSAGVVRTVRRWRLRSWAERTTFDISA